MRALRILLANAIDYAGLFPPAALDMPAAVRNYSTYRDGASTWALGRFVVPVARLTEFEACAAALPSACKNRTAWRVSALLGGDARGDLRVVTDFNARRATAGAEPAIVIDSVETKVSELSVLRGEPALTSEGLQVAYEMSPDPNLGEALGPVVAAGGIAKIRLGGLVDDAFPPVGAVADWLWTAARAGVRIKATAGLHHPLRGKHRVTYEPASPMVTMHGFLNVLLGAAVARSLVTAGVGNEGRRLVEELLSESSASAFHVDDDVMGWRGRSVSAAELRAARAFVVGFGSCSFVEPIDELRALGFPLGASD